MDQKTFFDIEGVNNNDDKTNQKKHSYKNKEGKNKSNKKGGYIKKTHTKNSKNKKENRGHTESQDYESFFLSVEHNGGGRNKVVFSTHCKHIRDNNIGLYCRLGTRKVRKVKKGGVTKIVCLDCDEPGKTYEEIKSKHFDKLWKQKRNG